MKSYLKKISGLLALGLFAVGANASTILQDNFESYAQGALPTNNLNITISPWTAITPGATPNIQVIADPTGGSANALQVSQNLTMDMQARFSTNVFAGITSVADVTTTNAYGTTTNLTYGFSPSNSVNALYASMKLYVPTIPNVASSSQTYFTHFSSDASGFRARIFLITNGAAPGNFRIAIQNAGTAITNVLATDLSPNTAYTLVSRYVLRSASSTVWVNPTSEVSGTSATAFDSQSPATINAYAFRQNTGEGVIDVDNLIVGTSFADVVPGSVNPPAVVIQPQDNLTVFAGQKVSFTNLATGDATISYQWYYNTNTLLANDLVSVSGATTPILTLTNLAVIQSGTYSCVSSNAAGTNVTRYATLLVNNVPVPPTITNQPAGGTYALGDTVTLTVGAYGLPVPAYQWKFVTNGVTNIITGATSPTYSFSATNVNQSGSYFATLTNTVGTSNTVLAAVQVNLPALVNISTLRSMVDPGTYAPTNTSALVSAQGIVTTWTNMSTGGASFFMQDSTAGINVFWAGAAAASNVPPAGALVRVVAPLSSFNNLLEMNPNSTNFLHSVTVISTGNPLPAPQPLVFDPNVLNNLAAMKRLEGTYFVASNVTLTAGATFVSNSNEAITNNVYGEKSSAMYGMTYTNGQGQTATLFVNSYVGIAGQAKPSGPVTIFGVLGNYKNLFEFTPSRYADIVSYDHTINVLSNARKGDLATNTYTELVLRPGETLSTRVSIADAVGGTITLTPVLTGLSANSSWTKITNGLTATGLFTFTPTQADAGVNYTVQLNVSSTSGTAYAKTFTVYVPTASEQLMAITEFMANPTTNSGAAYFNPLQRPTDTIGISTNDQYVEIANMSGSDLGPYGWTLDNGNVSKPTFDSNGGDGSGYPVPAANSLVIYGGNDSEAPGLATPKAKSTSLLLTTSGSGVLILRNGSGLIIDRVVYSAGDLSTNGSLVRFPTINSAFVPQNYVSTNHVTPGAQYNGGSWAAATSVPQGVSPVSVSVTNNQVFLKFTANTAKAATLWRADNVAGPFTVVNGGQFASPAAIFSETNLPSSRFYFITTQQ
ncbi:MAG: immunoglobulin domain-containing protein [Verrucomicrobiota bacterium]